jgi:hypothetical protein
VHSLISCSFFAAIEPTQVKISDQKRLNEVKRVRAATEACESPLTDDLERGVIVECARELGVKKEARL